MSRRRAATIATPGDAAAAVAAAAGHHHHSSTYGQKTGGVPGSNTWNLVEPDPHHPSHPRHLAVPAARTPLPPVGGELSIAFHTADDGVPVPPAFYPGQSIPTVLAFDLPHGTSLPLSLSPNLTLSLVGTLAVEGESPRVVVDISVSLARGLALWARDAGAAVGAADPYSPSPPHVPALLAGCYTLPLSVQVPCTPRLPPSFGAPDAPFALSYALCVALTCDAPRPDEERCAFPEAATEPERRRPPAPRRRRALVAYASAVFELLPYTLPTPPPRILPHSFWIPSAPVSVSPSPGRSSSPTLASTDRWVLSASLPTSTYSPTSVIPLELVVHPPSMEPMLVSSDKWHHSNDEDGAVALRDRRPLPESWSESFHACREPPPPPLPSPPQERVSEIAMVVRVSLVREDRINDTLVATHPVLARIGWLPIPLTAAKGLGQAQPVRLRPGLPLLTGERGGWGHGFSTDVVLAHTSDYRAASRDPEDSGAADTRLDIATASAAFQLRIDMLFLPVPSDGDPHARAQVQSLFDYLPSAGVGLGVGQDGDTSIPPLPGPQAARLWARIQRQAAASASASAGSCSGPARARTLSIPLTIGSVSEPRGALYTHHWSDLQLHPEAQPAAEGGGDETEQDGPLGPVGRMIHGAEVSCEDGWLCAPPPYECAIQDAPYVLY